MNRSSGVRVKAVTTEVCPKTRIPSVGFSCANFRGFLFGEDFSLAFSVSDMAGIGVRVVAGGGFIG